MHEDIEIIKVDISRIVPHPQNYKKHPAAQLAELKASLIEFGQMKPTVVARCADSDQLMTLAGHGVTEAANELLLEAPEKHARFLSWWVAIAPPSWTPAQARAYMVADNELARKAQNDEYALAALLEEQKNIGFDLAALGSSAEELDTLLTRLANEQLQSAPAPEDEDAPTGKELAEPLGGDVEATFGVLVECNSEAEQEQVYEMLSGEGYRCRVLTL
jgi:ParB-like chromosome segregation protein Spo0J